MSTKHGEWPTKENLVEAVDFFNDEVVAKVIPAIGFDMITTERTSVYALSILGA